MIRADACPVTGRTRTAVECDTPGCDRAEWLHLEIGVHHAATLMERAGWQIGDRIPIPGASEFPALCPTHASDTAPCDHEHPHHTIDRVTICGRCGQRHDTTPQVAPTPRVAPGIWFKWRAAS